VSGSVDQRTIHSNLVHDFVRDRGILPVHRDESYFIPDYPPQQWSGINPNEMTMLCPGSSKLVPLR
jgi:hypothetical protein